MPLYRKKPVVIEAVKCRDVLTNPDAAPDWLREAIAAGDVMLELTRAHIHTSEGTVVAGSGDWILRGVKGEIYPCKPDIFAVTYEEAAHV